MLMHNLHKEPNKKPTHCEAQLAAFSVMKTKADWQFLVCDQNSSVGLWVHDYKSLSVAVIISETLVNTQTHTQTAFDRLHY